MKDLFGSVYYNKKVLVTGHTGFKGSWMALWLSHMGADVVGYSLLPNTSPSHGALLKQNIRSVTGNILDLDQFQQTINQEEPEIIFHLAAQSLVRKSYKEPLETFATNTIGTANILEACRNAKSAKAVIVITSDKCYENREWIWGYRENDPLGGHDPYSASKGCAEIIASSYRHSFFPIDQYGKGHETLIATARAGNVIGGGDWAEDRLIPDIVRATIKKEKVNIRHPKATRPWQHVLESLSGYLLLGQMLLEGKKEYAEAWNFGPGDEGNLHVETVVKKLQNYWNAIGYQLCDQKDLYEVIFLHLDCSKARTKLKWKPVMDIDKALEMTGNWYRNFYELGDVITGQQLMEYVQKACEQKLRWAE